MNRTKTIALILRPSVWVDAGYRATSVVAPWVLGAGAGAACWAVYLLAKAIAAGVL